MTITTKGNLLLEKKEDNGWKIVSTWAINTTGTVNMVKIIGEQQESPIVRE